MISPTGNNLSILIVTETGKDWEAFATWYSIFKNLPDAKVSIASFRNSETPFQYFQWAKRLKIPVYHFNPFHSTKNLNWLNILYLLKKKLSDNILVMNTLTMCLSPLDEETLIKMKGCVFNEDIWCLQNPNTEELINQHFFEEKLITDSEPFCFEAKENESPQCLISYKKGCGKWINKLKGCPFANAAGLTTSDMTINEIKIVELWKRMCNLYSVVI